MYQYQYKQAMCEYKYQKKIRCDGKQLPEFQGQLAQQLVGVSGVVLVAGKVGTLVRAPPRLAIHWLPPQSGRSQPERTTCVNFQTKPKQNKSNVQISDRTKKKYF